MRWVYVYLLRVPALAALALGALAPLALHPSSPASPLLRGTFDVDATGVALITLMTILTAVGIVLNAEMVVRYGHLRFGVPELPGWLRQVVACPTAIELSRATAIASAAAMTSAVVLIVSLVWFGRDGRIASAIGVAAGAASAALVIALLIWLWKRTTAAAAQYLGVIVLWTPEGYLEPAEQASAYRSLDAPARPHLLPGHGFLTLAASVTLIVYAVLGLGRWADFPIPALGCIVVLIALLLYGCSAGAFLLDRFRVPLFVPALVLAIAASDWPQSDHYFDAPAVAAAPERVAPSDVLQTTLGDRAIVVAASGGGIQAAAWAAAVLARLEERHDHVHQRVRLISAVSGGSVGTMYYLDAIHNDRLNAASARAVVFDRASASSLDDIAWGLIYPDFWRFLTPMLVSSDRGYAAERAWARLAPGVTAPIGLWRRNVKSGTMPAVAFNATIEDTGGRIIMGTTDFPDAPLVDGRRIDRRRGQLNFAEWFPGREPTIVAAARMSATFTYVSPSARVERYQGAPAYHLVDGGYYDNYGVSSLIDWLRDAIIGRPSRLKRILILQIRGPMALTEPEPSKGRGVLRQILAPFRTLTAFRDTAQVTHNGTELQLLCEAAPPGIGVENVVFQYPSRAIPLSWHLTEEEREEVWQTAGSEMSDSLAKVAAFLDAPADGETPRDCQQFRR